MLGSRLTRGLLRGFCSGVWWVVRLTSMTGDGESVSFLGGGVVGMGWVRKDVS